MISKFLGKLLETTALHVTAGAASKVVEEGINKAQKKYKEWNLTRKLDEKEAEEEVEPEVRERGL